MKKRFDYLLAISLVALTLWAACVGLAITAQAARWHEQPDAQMLQWTWVRLSRELQVHGNSFAGWNAKDILQMFWAEKDRPYERIALLDAQDNVIASVPAGWEGQNARDIHIGDQTLFALAEAPPFYNHAYVKGAPHVPFPYSGRYVVADSLGLWPPAGAALPSPVYRGRLVAVRPALIFGKPYWGTVAGAQSWVLRTAWGTPPVLLGLIVFPTYWVTMAMWVFRDARRRGERGLPWGLLTLATNVIGLVTYLLARPGATCAQCRRHLMRTWPYCPHCGTTQHVPS